MGFKNYPFLPAITIVNSPRGSVLRNFSSASLTVPRNISSNRFVSSRVTTTSRSPSTSRTSSRKRRSRCGDSKRINVLSSSARTLNWRFLLPDLGERKPSKVKLWSGRPETDAAVTTADAPGIGTIGMSAAIHPRKSGYPGSEMIGVPASGDESNRLTCL